MAQTGVSVVMPVYNGERFLAETIESVLSQTFKDLELIAVDDGSSDASLSILEEYAERDPRVVVLRLNHGGLPVAVNAGIRQAKYDLIARIDSDDRMLPQRLERQVSFLEERPYLSVACSDCIFIDTSGRRIGRSSCRIDVDRGKRERCPGLFVELAHPTVIMRKADVIAVGGYREDLRYAEDRHLWGRLATSGFSIECQNEYLVEFRLHGGAMTMSRAEMQREICAWIDLNIVRRLDGVPEFSMEEFRAWEQRQPLTTKLKDRIRFTSIHSFKKASRFYGERKYLRCALSLATAVSLNPGQMVGRVLSRITSREARLTT